MGLEYKWDHARLAQEAAAAAQRFGEAMILQEMLRAGCARDIAIANLIAQEKERKRREARGAPPP